MRASKLHEAIKKLVVKEMETWPKTIEPPELLSRLDKFAENVIETQKIIDIGEELKKR